MLELHKTQCNVLIEIILRDEPSQCTMYVAMNIDRKRAVPRSAMVLAVPLVEHGNHLLARAKYVQDESVYGSANVVHQEDDG